MMSISPHQLRCDVQRVLQKDPEALVIGLHATGRWTGNGTLEISPRQFTVVSARTVLEVREALDIAERERRATVILTPVDQSELGHDVVARLARARLFSIDIWQGVLNLFDARQIDPALGQRCLAQALLDHAPPSGKFPPVGAGVLDAATAWRAILHHAFGLEDREPDLPGLLRWAMNGAEKYLAAPAELKEATRVRLTASLGAAAGSILNLVESASARDALALAIACEVVFAEPPGDAGLHHAAAARLERFHRNEPISLSVGQTLARAAAAAVDELAQEEPNLAMAQLHRADVLLKEIQARPLAYLGRQTPLALEEQLRRFANALEPAVTDPSTEKLLALDGALKEIEAHHLARQPERRPRVDRARMAIRLVRWLQTGADLAGSLGDLSVRYRDELSFVDWARDALSGGDELSELSVAYGCLEQAVTQRREGFNKAFATALADWTVSGSDPGMVWRVEDVLARAVGPIAQAKLPVLLIVLDGMSWAVARELLADLKKQHWAEAQIPGLTRTLPPVISAIPSMTEVARTSLLAGHLLRGHQDDERRLFPVHHAVLAHCERSYPPRVFHKGELTCGSRGALARPVEEAILELRNRVIGVVINAVDDRLAGAAQVRDVWSSESIRPLGTLLRMARETGRVVICASDHGHIWQRNTAGTAAEVADARWRPADGPVRDGEIVLEGGRVRGPGDSQRIIAPWSELIRYGGIRNGYHGGVTPQEMVAPVLVLSDLTARQPVLEPVEPRQPSWWDVPSKVRASTASHDKARPAPRIPDGFLFPLEPVEMDEVVRQDPGEPVPVSEPMRASWPESLFKSAAYQAQKQLVRKFAPDDEIVGKVLLLLDQHGGTMTPVALANQLGIPGIRLDGLLAKLQRMLNIDGYEVLHFDRQREIVELDLVLLKRQFEFQ